MLYRLVFCLILGLFCGCGEPEDPSVKRNNGSNPNSNSNQNNANTTSSKRPKIQNPSVRVFRDPNNDGCRVVTTNDGACPTYEVSFSIQNDTGAGIDRVQRIEFDFNGGFPNIDVNFTCDDVPWVIESGASSGVVDVKLEYRSQIDFEFVCGRSNNSDNTYSRDFASFDLLVGPEGPLDGELKLTLEGLFDDASSWTASATAEF